MPGALSLEPSANDAGVAEPADASRTKMRSYAGVVELVYTRVSKTRGRKAMWVRLPPPAFLSGMAVRPCGFDSHPRQLQCAGWLQGHESSPAPAVMTGGPGILSPGLSFAIRIPHGSWKDDSASL